MNMITELNFAKLTPASFAMANANDVDVGAPCCSTTSDTGGR